MKRNQESSDTEYPYCMQQDNEEKKKKPLATNEG